MLFCFADIDECSVDAYNLCSHRDLCVNTVGSYTCGCPADFELKADEKTCTCKYAYVSHDMRFPTMWYVRPAKSQTNLCIRTV